MEGRLKVYFYDTEAGSRDIEPTAIPARASPQVLLRIGMVAGVQPTGTCVVCKPCAGRINISLPVALMWQVLEVAVDASNVPSPDASRTQERTLS